MSETDLGNLALLGIARLEREVAKKGEVYTDFVSKFDLHVSIETRESLTTLANGADLMLGIYEQCEPWYGRRGKRAIAVLREYRDLVQAHLSPVAPVKSARRNLALVRVNVEHHPDEREGA